MGFCAANEQSGNGNKRVPGETDPSFEENCFLCFKASQILLAEESACFRSRTNQKIVSFRIMFKLKNTKADGGRYVGRTERLRC